MEAGFEGGEHRYLAICAMARSTACDRKRSSSAASRVRISFERSKVLVFGLSSEGLRVSLRANGAAFLLGWPRRHHGSTDSRLASRS
jgi:hypothetical protein